MDNSALLLVVNSNTRLPANNVALFNARMENKTVRRANLIALIEQLKTIEALARVSGIPAAYLSQIKNKTREMGDKTARRIEAGLGKDKGWIDVRQFGGEEAVLEQAEALEIMRKLSDEDRQSWLKHGRLLVLSMDGRKSDDPHAHAPKEGKK